MIDALAGGLEAEKSDDGLSDASDSEDEGAGEFANVINEMNNKAGNSNDRGEEVDEEEDADDAGIGVQGLVWLRVDDEGHQRADKGQPGAADDGVVSAVAGVAPPDEVTPAVARPRGRGPGRSRNVPARAAGVVGPPPVAGVVGAPPAVGVVGARPLAQRAPRVAAALRVCAVEAPRGRAFPTPINRGRKRHGDDVDIRWGGTNSYFKYEFVLHTPAGLAWLSRTNKGDMVLTDSKWSCGPPAYRFLS